MRYLAIVVAAATLLSAMPATAIEEPEGVAPSFAIGDWWKYRLNGGPMGGTVRYSVKGFERVTSEGKQYDSVSFSYSGSGTYDDGTVAGNWHAGGTYYLERDDRATIMDSATFTVDGVVKGSGEDARLVVNVYAAFDPPLKTVRFPLKGGMSYQQTVTMHERQSATLNGQKPTGGDYERVGPQAHSFSVTGPVKQT
ncbi:MAG: hypothetical protein ACREF4_20530, partial [Gammaproteobacteria bacterium]